jgi:glycosyltransferase involved in cell wall biosynthesis
MTKCVLTSWLLKSTKSLRDLILKEMSIKGHLRIAFVHNLYIKYRAPFFEKLNNAFNLTFFFDQVDATATTQGSHLNSKLLRSFSILRKGETRIYDCTLSPALLYYLLRGRFDLFIGANIGHIGTYVAFLVSRLRRKPFILWDETWYWPETIIRMLAWPFIKIMVDKAEAIVAPGSKSKEFFVSLGAKPIKVYIAPNTSEIRIRRELDVESRRLKRKLGLEDKKIVLYFGRLAERKGLYFLIKAFDKLRKEISDTFLLVCWTRPSEEKLKNVYEKLCIELGIKNVLFARFTEEEDRDLYYSLADVFVLPAIKTNLGTEIWGLVLNEAMSVGKPVVTTRAVGAAYDLIKDGVNGFLVPDKNSEALYKAIKSIVSDPYNKERMGLQSLKILSDGFAYEHMVHGFVKAVRHVLRNSQRKLMQK